MTDRKQIFLGVTPKNRRWLKVNREGHVYFLRAEGTQLFKVGCAVNPQRRIEGFITGCPYTLICVAMVHVSNMGRGEKVAHLYLREHRLRREWFECGEDVIALAVKHVADTTSGKIVEKPVHIDAWSHDNRQGARVINGVTPDKQLYTERINRLEANVHTLKDDIHRLENDIFKLRISQLRNASNMCMPEPSHWEKETLQWRAFAQTLPDRYLRRYLGIPWLRSR